MIYHHETIFTGKEAEKALNNYLFKPANRHSSTFILTDQNTHKHCLPVLSSKFRLPEDSIILEIESGEVNKNLNTCIRLWKELAAHGADRHSLLMCLGGGMLCDIGGFVASAYQRGINRVYIPTTLLSQVDASIGGKTGVNLDKLKNYVGFYSPPKAVFIISDFLKTLPDNEMLSGYGEVVKHALLSDDKYFHNLTKQFPNYEAVRFNENWADVVERSVKIKSNVVKSDPYEHGLRKVLNLGHTVGHAFESYSLENDAMPLLHGFSVAMGLIVELKLSVWLCGFSEMLANEIIKYILAVFPYYRFQKEEIPKITGIMNFDKKNRDGKIRLTLLKKPGDLITNVICTQELIEKSLLEYLDLADEANDLKF